MKFERIMTLIAVPCVIVGMYLGYANATPTVDNPYEQGRKYGYRECFGQLYPIPPAVYFNECTCGTKCKCGGTSCDCVDCKCPNCKCVIIK